MKSFVSLNSSVLPGLTDPFYGLKVVESKMLEKVAVAKTFKERWLSWPWKPWEKNKVVERFGLKDGEILKMGDVLVMNPNTRMNLIEQMKKG